MRPDRWGIVIDTLDIPGEQVILLYFWEYTEGRYADHDVQQIIKGLAETGKFIVVGRPMNKEQEFHFPSTMTEEDSIRFAESITTYFESRETEAKAVGA
ncbi:MAG: hypothetical protein ABIT47_03755 [Candidatus Paceibacterota bacterium]